MLKLISSYVSNDFMVCWLNTFCCYRYAVGPGKTPKSLKITPSALRRPKRPKSLAQIFWLNCNVEEDKHRTIRYIDRQPTNFMVELLTWNPALIDCKPSMWASPRWFIILPSPSSRRFEEKKWEMLTFQAQINHLKRLVEIRWRANWFPRVTSQKVLSIQLNQKIVLDRAWKDKIMRTQAKQKNPYWRNKISTRMI